MNTQLPGLIATTTRSWQGMVRILFQPFDIKKWFVLGFTAWLAQLMQSGGGGNGSANSRSQDTAGQPIENQQQANERYLQWVQDHLEMIITVASIVLIVGVAIYITLVWVRSRGKFMFLDNVVHNRCQVRAPWNEFKGEGDSLCKWTLMLVVVFGGILLLFAGLTGWYVFGMIQSQVWTTNATLSMIAVGLVVFALALVWGYISVLLENFIVPIMYRDRITATAAWRKFLPLHRRAFWRFILFALWMLLLGVAILIVVIVVGFATCCVGWIIMALPYVGTVLLLPVYVFTRLLGPDYLRQFGDEFDALTVRAPELPQSMLGSGDGAV